MSRKVVSMKTLASALGVTSATVSYALRGSAKVSSATRERIQAEALRQGYTLNPMVAAWMARVRGASSRSDLPVVAYVTGFSRAFHAKVPHLRELARGVEGQANFLGFPLRFIYGAGNRVSWDEVAQHCAAERVSGIILAPSPIRRPALLPWDQFSLTAIGYSVHHPPMHTIMDEHLSDTRTALEEFTRRGARRIGLVTTRYHESRFSHARVAAYLSWQQGLPVSDRIPVCRCATTRKDTTPRVLAWMKRHAPEVMVGLYSEDYLFGRQRTRSGTPYVQLSTSAGEPGFSKLRGTVEPNLEMGSLAMQTLAGLLYRHETGLPREPVEISIGGGLILTDADRKAFRKKRRPPQPADPLPSRVTLQDIARAIGVCTSTVSLALRDDPRIAATTRERVRQTAGGYRHNPLLDAWAGQYRATHRHAGQRIAHVSGFSENAYRANAMLEELRAHIVGRATELGISVEVFHTGPAGLSTGRLRGILQARGMDAVIWGPFPPGEAAVLDVEDWLHTIRVGLGDTPTTRTLNRVILSRYLSMRSLIRRLLEAGYRKPGLAGFGPAGEPDLRGWVPAYLHAKSTRPARYSVPWLPLEEAAHKPFDAWLGRYRPDVVLSPFTALREWSAGAAFVAIEPEPDRLPPDLAAVLYPAASIGRGAVDILIAHCDLHQRGRPAVPQRTAYHALFRAGVSCPGLQ